MKVIRNLLFVSVFSFAGTFLMAGNTTGVAKPENKQIRELLSTVQFDKLINYETKLNISFFVNGKNELIVVSTNNAELDQAIKNALNYHKIIISELEYNKVYTLPVVIK